jgi:anti-anti-sigma factor
VALRGDVVALRGDLDVTSAADTESATTALMARGQWLVIDMPALDFMDCASLGAAPAPRPQPR